MAIEAERRFRFDAVEILKAPQMWEEHAVEQGYLAKRIK